MPEIVKSDMLGTDGFQDLLTGCWKESGLNIPPVLRRLLRQQFLLDPLGQTITGNETVETRFLPQNISQIRYLQE